jgi:Arv1-like family
MKWKKRGWKGRAYVYFSKYSIDLTIKFLFYHRITILVLVFLCVLLYMYHHQSLKKNFESQVVELVFFSRISRSSKFSLSRKLFTTKTMATDKQSYRCIYCLQPCESLYYRYGDSSSTNSTSNNSRTTTRTTDTQQKAISSVFKLNRCIVCTNVVDPYCEREWLLIILDLILLRGEAYRHILCNSTNTNYCVTFEKQQQHQHGTGTDTGMNVPNTCRCNLWRDITISCILRVYLQFQSTESFAKSLVELVNSESSYDLQNAHRVVFDVSVSFFNQFVLSLIGHFAFIVVLLLLGVQNIPDKDDIHDDRYPLRYQYGMVLKSAVWPTIASQLATCWISVWENSTTTRLLGCTALPLMYQWMALYHTLIATSNSVQKRKRYDNATKIEANIVFLTAVKATIILTTAVVARSATMILLSPKGDLVDDSFPSGCLGLEVILNLSTKNTVRVCLA